MKNKNNVTNISILVIALLLALAVFSCSGKNNEGGSTSIFSQKYDPEDDFIANPIDGGKGVEIIGYVGSKWEINISTKIQNINVSSIGNSAFKDKNLIKVVIPNSVTSIGDYAFTENQLTSIKFPDNITSIGNRAFNENQLTSVTFPNSITSIGDYAFAENQLTSIIIPNNVTSIGYSAFAGNKLTSIKFPDDITSIDFGAFMGCNLTSIIIPNSVTSIGDYAFSENQLTSVTIGANVNLEDEKNSFAFDDRHFAELYYSNGRQAGTYIRSDANSSVWTKR